MELNPDFMEIAAKLDTERSAGRVRGPLHGIPFLVKDNIASKDKMETTAGSWALLGSIVPRDAYVVHRLREAGALLFGKATLSEWADMRSNNYSEGYSPRGGQARSPYNLTLNPGGSSSGSAAAVAANLCMFALGTETDGSGKEAHLLDVQAVRVAILTFPLPYSDQPGGKEQPGWYQTYRGSDFSSWVHFSTCSSYLEGTHVSGSVIPESQHQDSVGTFARTVRDAVYALDGIYGIDPLDNYTLGQTGKTPTGGYTQFLTDKQALKGAVFGLPWQSFWALADPAQQAQLLDLIDLIREAGATVINGTELPDYQTIVSPTGWNW